MAETREVPRILIGVGKPETPFPTEKRYAFALAGASQKDQETVDDINIILKGVSAFDSWSTSHQGDQPTDLPSWLRDLYIESEGKCELLDAMRNLSNYEEDSEKDRVSLRTKIEQTIPTNLPPATTIAKESPEEISVLQKNLGGILHDIGNPLSVTNQYSLIATEAHTNNETDFNYQEATSSILRSFARMSQAIENGNNILNKKYSKEPLMATDLYAELQKYFYSTRPALNITIQKPSDIPDVTTQWSPAWLGQLTDNIIQNTQKAYRAAGEMGKPIDKPTLAISFQSEDPHHIDILYDDNGTGFPPDIVEGGFKSGRTQWEGGVKGTGTGMAFHADTLEKQYGGKLIPTNRIDANGTILGGRLIVRLPITTLPTTILTS